MHFPFTMQRIFTCLLMCAFQSYISPFCFYKCYYGSTLLDGCWSACLSAYFLMVWCSPVCIWFGLLCPTWTNCPVYKFLSTTIRLEQFPSSDPFNILSHCFLTKCTSKLKTQNLIHVNLTKSISVFISPNLAGHFTECDTICVFVSATPGSLVNQLTWHHVIGTLLFIWASLLQKRSLSLLAKMRTDSSGIGSHWGFLGIYYYYYLQILNLCSLDPI